MEIVHLPPLADEAQKVVDHAIQHMDGVNLLRDFLEALAATGWRRYRVDTWRDRGEQMLVRHAYSGGEWRISTSFIGSQRGTPRATHTIKYDLRGPLPTVEQLIIHTILGPQVGAEFDSNREMMLRGE